MFALLAMLAATGGPAELVAGAVVAMDWVAAIAGPEHLPTAVLLGLVAATAVLVESPGLPIAAGSQTLVVVAATVLVGCSVMGKKSDQLC